MKPDIIIVLAWCVAFAFAAAVLGWAVSLFITMCSR